MFTLNCNGKLWTIDRPVVMGIINATPDSFYGASRHSGVDEVLDQAAKMITDGAAILDIGGQSTRPGSKQIGANEEMDRVVPLISAITRKYPETLISVDTYNASVAEAAVQAGASIVNDIGGGFFDEQMLTTVARLRVPYILMHVKGNANTMHQDPVYENVTQEVLDYFIRRLEDCKQAGIQDIIIDPGFGFSKTINHNFQLLKDLEVFGMFHKPLLLGISRKSTIYKTLNTTPEQALNGTTVLNTAGLLKGAAILRVHDVKEAVEAITLVEALRDR